MSEPTIFTAEQLTDYLRRTVSEKRFIHSLGVAGTTEDVLVRFRCTNYEKSWKGFSAATFCGLAHDIAREMTDAELLDYCRKNNVYLSTEDIEAPVLAHGTVSAEIAMGLAGAFPFSWYRALCTHTTGNAGMDDLALALFIADYIEPSRTFMAEEKRAFYLGAGSIYRCAYRILCDMIDHWRAKGFHDASSGSLAMKAWLEKSKGCIYG
ncbi:MAG: hypothetical protein J5775_01365 [Spirochaetales bacterium]|nr:hypothetical protein [Spirochaetales bacterium]